MLIYLAELHDNRNDVDCSQDHCETLGAFATREAAVAAIRAEQAKPRTGWDRVVPPLEGDAGWFDGCNHFYAIWETEVR